MKGKIAVRVSPPAAVTLARAQVDANAAKVSRARRRRQLARVVDQLAGVDQLELGQNLASVGLLAGVGPLAGVDQLELADQDLAGVDQWLLGIVMDSSVALQRPHLFVRPSFPLLLLRGELVLDHRLHVRERRGHISVCLNDPCESFTPVMGPSNEHASSLLGSTIEGLSCARDRSVEVMDVEGTQVLVLGHALTEPRILRLCEEGRAVFVVPLRSR